MAGTGASVPELRALVRDVLREALPELIAARNADSGAVSPGSAESRRADPVHVLQVSHDEPAADRPPPAVERMPPDGTDVNRSPADGVELVRLDCDRDLDAFVHRLARLFDNPKFRSEVRAGKRRFALAPNAARAAGPLVRRRIEKGAVTEAQVKDAARAGASLVLGRRAVLTPLARDKARTLGVAIEKER